MVKNRSFTSKILQIYLSTAVLNFHNCFAKNPVWNTAECRTLASVYKSNLNPKINPCYNFYEYVCHGWEKKYSQEILYNYWNPEKNMQERVYLDLKKLLEEKKSSRIQEVEQAKRLYKICENTPYMERSDATKLKHAMWTISPWPLPNPQMDPTIVSAVWIMNKMYLEITGDSAFFDYKILTYSADRNKIVTKLQRPFSPYGMLLRYAPWQDAEIGHYKKFLLEIMKKMTAVRSIRQSEALQRDFHAVMMFREDMREIAEQQRPEVFVEMTVKEFQDWYNSRINNKRNAQTNWLDLLRAIYKTQDPHSQTASQTSTIIVNQQYFSKLGQLLGRTDTQILEMHMTLYFLERQLKLDTTMKMELKRSFYDSFPHTGKIRFEVARWRTCIINHNMKETLARMYLDSYFPKNKKENVDKMVKEVKRLLSRHIENSNWVTPRTKQDSLNKINHINADIGYLQTYIENALNAKDAEEEITPLDVDMYYDHDKNRICVTAAYLQTPMCGLNFPYPIIYGSVMSALGHEIYHAFDEEGITCGPMGNNIGWPKSMCEEYAKQAKCFYDQYENFRANLLKIYNPKRHPNEPHRRTVKEDISDVMGLKLAYIGFKEKLTENKGVCPTLPGFEDFSCEKLFFIAFANTLCTYNTPEYKESVLMDSEHSLPEIRVNGAVSNLREFSTAFGCKPGDPMKLIKTCNLWQK